MSISYKLNVDLAKSLNELDNLFSSTYVALSNAPEDERNALKRYARISMIGASTRIENALLTDSEVNWIDTILTHDGKTTSFRQYEGVIKDKLHKDRERSIEEVAGCRAMLLRIYQDYQSFKPITEVDIRALHHELLTPYQKAKEHAGRYKTSSNSVIEHNHYSGEARTVFKTADPGPMTTTAMRELVDWYNHAVELSAPPVAIVCEFVYRFLAIHPFQDGNGRLGRGLFLLGLLNSNVESICMVAQHIAIDRYIEKHKEEYYYVLNRCSDGKFHQDPKTFKIQYFLKFMNKVLSEAMSSIPEIQQKYHKERALPESATKVLQCFRDNPETRLMTSDLIKQTNLPRRTVVRGISLLLDAKLIQKYGQAAGTRYQITF